MRNGLASLAVTRRKALPVLGRVLLLAPLAAAAQVRTDGSLGHPAQNLTGPNYVIPQSAGLLAGANLFQSFSVFNLATSGSADFTTTSAGIANVISRVTGGTPSSILGPIFLSPAAGSPNFFFINPAGITFGAGTSINVPGAVHISTANYLKFADGNFYSDLAHTSTFSTLSPEAFGFLGTTRSSISVAGGSFIGAVGAPISVVAGDIAVDNSDIVTFAGGDVIIAAVGADKVEVPLTGALPSLHGTLSVTNGGEIAAYASTLDSGAIRVSAGTITINSEGSSLFTGIFTDTPSATGNSGPITIAASGSMTLTNGGSVSTTSETSGNAGTLSVTVAGPLTLASGAEIYSNAYATGNASPVAINAGSLSIDGSGTQPTGILSFASSGSGNAASVQVTSSGAIDLANGGFISANTYTSGRGGNLSVAAAGPLSVSNGAAISSDALGTGAAGDVTVSAASINVTGSAVNATGISSNSQFAGSGPPGNVFISTPGRLTLLQGGEISSVTSSSFTAGSIAVSAGSIAIDGQGVGITTGISTDTVLGIGNAGTISVRTPGALTIVNGGEITSSSALSVGQPGRIVVDAGALYIDGSGNLAGAGITSTSNSSVAGRGGDVTVSVAGALTILDEGFIDADTFFNGDGGAVRVNAGQITINGQGTLETGITSQSFAGLSHGSAGTVLVTVEGTLQLLNGGVISSSTSSGTGRAGSVVVNARDIVVDGAHSSIDAAAFFGSSGQTGNVSVAASDSLTVSDYGVLSILNSANSAHPAALVPTQLSITAPDLAIGPNGLVNASSTGNIDAGNILINFSNVMTLDPSAIGTVSYSGNGGSITIIGGRELLLDHSAILTSVFGPAGNGGDIRIKADVLVMDSGFIQANAAARNASGGTVSIDVDALIASDNSLFVGGSTPYRIDYDVPGFNVIQAAAPAGLSGVIEISTPALDLAANLSALGARLLDRGGLGRSRCQTSGGSSLAQGGRGGFASAARELLRAERSDDEAAGATANGARAAEPDDGATASIAARWACAH